jgi:hypothetical protein
MMNQGSADWDGYEDDLFDEESDYVDCGLMPDGQCTKAGTEECDWDCGRLNDARIAAMKVKP